jgi:hypothetical protein
VKFDEHREFDEKNMTAKVNSIGMRRAKYQNSIEHHNIIFVLVLYN